MKWYLQSSDILVWLVVMTTIFHTSQAMCMPEGKLTVIGINTGEFIAGRLEICDDQGEWKKVCQDGWDDEAAMVACQQILGQRGYAAMTCNNSCFGGDGGHGMSGFNCTGEEDTSLNCSHSDIVTPTNCTHHAGVLCCIDNSTCPTILWPQQTSMPHSACNSTCMQAATDCSCPETSEDNAGESCASLKGGLGTLIAILVILLVGVVILAWYCLRKKGHQKKLVTTAYPNPGFRHASVSNNTDSYNRRSLPPTLTAPPFPVYSKVNKKKKTFRPADQDGGNRAFEGGRLGGKEGQVYHVLEGPKGVRGDGDYEEVDVGLLGQALGERKGGCGEGGYENVEVGEAGRGEGLVEGKGGQGEGGYEKVEVGLLGEGFADKGLLREGLAVKVERKGGGGRGDGDYEEIEVGPLGEGTEKALRKRGAGEQEVIYEEVEVGEPAPMTTEKKGKGEVEVIYGEVIVGVPEVKGAEVKVEGREEVEDEIDGELVYRGVDVGVANEQEVTSRGEGKGGGEMKKEESETA